MTGMKIMLYDEWYGNGTYVELMVRVDTQVDS